MRFRKRHNLKIKPHVTREPSRFSNQRLRSHWNLSAFRSAKGGLQYDPYARRPLFRFVPLFHDSTRLVDPLEDFWKGKDDVSYRPLLNTGSKGQTDHRLYHPLSYGDSSRSSFVYENVKRSDVARVPAVVQKKQRQIFLPPPSPMVVPSKDKDGAYLQFNFPRQVLVCVRRHQRREVLFALGRAGGGHKPPKWNDDSYIRC